MQEKLGVWLIFEMGSVSQRGSVAQEEEVSSKLSQTKLPLWTHFIRAIRQPGSDVSASALLLSHIISHREAINTQMRGLTLHVVSGTL